MKQAIATVFEEAALRAGKAIMEICNAGTEARFKADCSPVTEADERAEAIILKALHDSFPDIPVIAEEAVSAGHVPEIEGRSFILVDPLDGTKEFISGKPDFTVNIALIENGQPVFGVVYAPALGVAYIGGFGACEKLSISKDFSVFSREAIKARNVQKPPVCVSSRSHGSVQTEAFIREAGACDIRAIGSSLKFCLLAEGSADLYPRFSRTMEWDTAAGDAVLRAAGGRTLLSNGQPLGYGKIGRTEIADFANPDFIAWGNLESAV